MLDKFEYQVREVSCQHGRGFLKNSPDEDRYFKVQGKLGWELVSVVSTAPNMNYDKTLYYWKKKIIPSESKDEKDK